MRKITWAPAYDWDAQPEVEIRQEEAKPVKKVKKPKKQSKKRVPTRR